MASGLRIVAERHEREQRGGAARLVARAWRHHVMLRRLRLLVQVKPPHLKPPRLKAATCEAATSEAATSEAAMLRACSCR